MNVGCFCLATCFLRCHLDVYLAMIRSRQMLKKICADSRSPPGGSPLKAALLTQNDLLESCLSCLAALDLSQWTMERQGKEIMPRWILGKGAHDLKVMPASPDTIHHPWVKHIHEPS